MDEGRQCGPVSHSVREQLPLDSLNPELHPSQDPLDEQRLQLYHDTVHGRVDVNRASASGQTPLLLAFNPPALSARTVGVHVTRPPSNSRPGALFGTGGFRAFSIDQGISRFAPVAGSIVRTACAVFRVALAATTLISSDVLHKTKWKEARERWVRDGCRPRANTHEKQ